ncbi:GDSL-type esterase/lipase family protein [Schinkia azotoformans]|uniref:GDSL-type esterase/lipase family protein n=1 Tax=Schinkia azotoformans TaxID=1454 RepID=UPI002DB63C68|nr:GDSL-type esterase/lipase family protein [Schinkia azotoformans]MEC1721476.1 GDSL-type esterase/lipase family protein [Schinkia azotoformans]MED4415731.1 GDSL-type esterase/lipase family protein [Schinkia azotoformans]
MQGTFKKLFFLSISVNLLLIFFIVKFNRNEEEIHAKAPDYLQNKIYMMRTSLFDVYPTKQANVAMLGDSITQAVDWRELLERNDVVNRGIRGDITEGMLNRLHYIYKLKPKMVFLMGGINDIRSNETAPEEIARNHRKIVTELIDRQIKPVITSTLYVSSSERKHKKINQKVDELNNMLKKLATENDIPFIDLNSKLANGHTLDQKYTIDGVHLMGNAYQIWGEQISEELKRAAGSGTLAEETLAHKYNFPICFKH